MVDEVPLCHTALLDAGKHQPVLPSPLPTRYFVTRVSPEGVGWFWGPQLPLKAHDVWPIPAVSHLSQESF